MATTGKRHLDRTHDRIGNRVLDARTRLVLQRILREDRDKALQANLRALGAVR